MLFLVGSGGSLPFIGGIKEAVCGDGMLALGSRLACLSRGYVSQVHWGATAAGTRMSEGAIEGHDLR